MPPRRGQLPPARQRSRSGLRSLPNPWGQITRRGSGKQAARRDARRNRRGRPAPLLPSRSMRARSGRARFAGVAGVALAALAGFLAPAAGSGAAPPKRPALATCFWEGPISTQRPTTRGFDGRNFNFPEESATYWMARFNLPAGSHLAARRPLSARPLHVAERLFGRRAHRRPLRHRHRAATRLDQPVRRRPPPRPAEALVARERVDEAPPARPPARAQHALRAAGEGPRSSCSTASMSPTAARPHRRHRAAARRPRDAADGSELERRRGLRRGQRPGPQHHGADHARRPCGRRPERAGLRRATNPAYDPKRWERFFTYDFAALA